MAVVQVARTRHGSDPLSNIYEGLGSAATAPPQGQTAPGPALSIPINGTGVRYAHISAERRQLIFSLALSLHPSSPDCVAAHSSGSVVYVTVCTVGDLECCRLRVCACGCSQWPKLEVIIMCWSACCCHANAVWSWLATALQLKANGSVFER